MSREDVARAALAAGMGGLSMPAVARRLGVSHSTLYRYVHDRDDLLLAAADLAVAEFEWPAPSTDWRGTLTALADALWAFLGRYPGMAEATFAMPGTPPAVAELIGRYTAALCAAGFAVEDALLALDFVVDLTLSTAVIMGDLDRVHQTPDGPRTLRELHQRSLPQLTALAPALADEMWSGRGWFDRKLAILLDGLTHRLPPPVENP